MYFDTFSIEAKSKALKRSMLRVFNNDHLCLVTAVGRCFLKLCEMVQSDRWKQVTKNDPKYMNTFMKVVKHRMTTKSYYKHVSGGKSYSKTMGLTLCREANLSTNKPLTIRDIGALEEVLDVKILVLSAKLGNKFCRVANDPECKNIYLYLTENPSGDGGHFDGIGSIHVFFLVTVTSVPVA